MFIDDVQPARPAEATASPDAQRNWRREKTGSDDIELYWV
ncbi:hypothetical protein AOX55_0000846 [Sinorhizobium fredii CCBAU 25509]|nr:hypothetical protein AOX55_0000846 [Sinorhizobium fredii CCBAU 25509]